MKIKFLLPLVMLLSISAVFAKQKIMVGRVEAIKILPENIRVEAKLDTGAYQSSLHALDIQEHLIKGKKYVSFKYPKSESGKFYEFDLPVYKYSKIKRRAADIGPGKKMYTTRPVVKLKICLAGKEQEIELNLTDREHFKQKMLIGRLSMNRFSVIINPTKEYLTIPNCS